MRYAQYCRLHVHVGASNREVVRKAHGLLHGEARRSAAMRKTRHEWLLGILAEHLAAREVVRFIR